MTSLLRCSLFLGLMLLAGCGQSTGVLTGSVTYEGRTITNGMVAVRSDDGRVDQANIQEDGTYRCRLAPLGEVKIVVQTFPPSPAVLPPGVKADSVKLPAAVVHIPIPERYSDFTTSKLTATVAAGETKHDIKLEK